MTDEDRHTYVPPVSVLTYHNIVGPHQENPNDVHSISIDRLNEQIAALTDAGFAQMTLADAFEALVDSRATTPGFVLTFDDGYASLAEYGPHLQAPLGPTVFILTDYVGMSTLYWNLRSSVTLSHLSLDEIKGLDERGFDIQIHGSDHHNLLKFDDDQLRTRFKAANSWLADKLGKTAEYLAYPYGYCDEHVERIASEFYRGAVSVSHGAWFGEGARFALNRVSIPYYLTGADLVHILQTPPEQRWLETEKRAPWRKA